MILNQQNLFFAILAVILATALSCTDSSTYTFGSYGSPPTTRDCAWITTNANSIDDRRAKWCSETVNGSVVEIECPMACDVCVPSSSPSVLFSELPSVAPTRPPSPRPSPFPSTRPTNNSNQPSEKPSKSLSPTLAHSHSPSSSPSILECPDSTTYTFGSYGSPPTTRNCAWITANPDSVADRRAKWCSEIVSGSIVERECPTACDICDGSFSSTPDPLFVDFASRFKVETPTGKLARSCEWVGRKDRMTRCSLPGVSSACPLTCENSTCSDPDDSLRFEVRKDDGSRSVRNCDWVRRQDKSNRCKWSGNICRLSCGRC